MRINSLNNINQIYQSNATMKLNQGNKAGSADSLEISNTAKDFQTALNAIKSSEDIREDKVQALKEQMQSGTYQVSNKEIADKIVNRFFKSL